MNFSLIELCLNKIANNFSRYFLALNKAKDGKEKQKFEFLRKFYSLELVARVAPRDGLPEEYVDFLINSYLNVLDVIWLKNCSMEKIISKIAEVGFSLEKILFPRTEKICRELQWREIMCCLPNLKSFTCNVSCDEHILKYIALMCPNIEEIDVRDTRIDNDAVKHLSEIEERSFYKNLKKLFISCTYINGDGIRYLLKYVPSIEVLDYIGLPQLLYTLHKSDSLDFKLTHCNITVLDMRCIENPGFVNIMNVCLSLCPNVRSFGYRLEYKNDLINFPKIPNIEHLYVDSELSDINVDVIFKYTGAKIISLTLRRCMVSLSVISACCPLIRELVFNEVDFVKHDSEIQFNVLSSLTFEHFDTLKNTNTLGLLLTSSNLKSLSFRNCNLMRTEIKSHILKCCEMRSINKISFFSSDIEKECVMFILSNCKTLRCLNLQACFSEVIEVELIKYVESLTHKPVININENSENIHYKDYLSNLLESKKYEFHDFVTDFEHVLMRKIVLETKCRLNL